LIPADRAEHRKRTSDAISSVVGSRLSGDASTKRFRANSGRCVVISVST